MQDRKKILDSIKVERNKVQEVRIRYNHEMTPFKTYRIPLEYLVYNVLNGRIGSMVKVHQKQYKELNAEEENDKKVLADFLWKSNPNKNKHTLENIIANRQEKFGIVTADGIVIDGNRRFMILNKIYNNRDHYKKIYKKCHSNIDSCEYFEAIILPHALAENKKEILRLETRYQMGQDEKLDYDSIEKYLKCEQLKGYGLTSRDIAQEMNIKDTDVDKLLGVKKMMDKYLLKLDESSKGYEDMYTMLDGKEDQFVQLHTSIEKLNNNNHGQLAQWNENPEPDDISDLETVASDYIRLGMDHRSFRIIGQLNKKENIFCLSETLWKEFLQDYSKMDEIKEKSVEEWRKERPDVKDLTDLLKLRDDEWKKNSSDILKKAYYYAEDKLKNLNDENAPIELVQKALRAINTINTKRESFYTEDVYRDLKTINSITYDLRNLIEDRWKKDKK